MQTIPYLAIASDTMIYTKDGNKMSLLDAYKVVDLGNNVKTLALVHNSENFVMLNRINQKLEKLIAGNISKDTLKEDEFNYVKKNFGNVTNIEVLMDLIGEKIAEEITFYKSPENKKIFIRLGQILNKLAV